MLSNVLISIICFWVLRIECMTPEQTDHICKTKKGVHVNDDLVKTHFPKGIYVAMMKKNEFKADDLAEEGPKDTRKWSHTTCFAADVKTGVAEVKGEGICHYNSPSFMSCTGFGSSAGLSAMKSYGDGWASETDNKNYIVYVGCVHNDKPFWVALSLVKELEEDLEKKILDHIESLGFDKAEAAPKDDPQRGTKVTEHPCKDKKNENSGGLIGSLFGGGR